MNKIKTLSSVALSILLLLLAAPNITANDVTRGQQLAQQFCASCHSFNRDGRHTIGPNLWGIYQRKAASAEGYRYPEAIHELARNGIVWNDENLNGYMKNPTAFILEKSGTDRYRTRMTMNIEDPELRSALTSYLKSLR